MRRQLTRILALALLGSGAMAGGSGWNSDFEKAAKTAKKAERPILIEFTKDDASDAINKNVFYKGKFKTWAKKNVVLLEIDLGKRVSKKLEKQYADLQKKYEVETFPTILLVDHEGKVLGKPAFGERTTLESWLAETGEIVEAAGSAGEWITDYEAAKKLARRTKKPMLLDFNGSDW
jgi:hypothetical protein